MPRDVVFSTTTDELPLVDWAELLAQLATDESIQLVPGQRGVGVHWSRGGGFVQLGPTAAQHDSGDDVEVPGHWVDLDWSGCNRLIRFLRHARDQAFGQPE